MAERLKYLSINIGNGSLVVSRCKNSKVILSAATSGCGESTIITNSEDSDWTQSYIGCGGHCRLIRNLRNF